MTRLLDEEQLATLRVVDALCSLFESLSLDFKGEFKWECHLLCERLENDAGYSIPEKEEVLARLREMRANLSTRCPGHVDGYEQLNRLIFLSNRLRQKLLPLQGLAA